MELSIGVAAEAGEKFGAEVDGRVGAPRVVGRVAPRKERRTARRRVENGFIMCKS